MRKIGTVEELTALYPEPMPLALKKVATRLTPLYRQWIEGSRFCILSTAGPLGVHGTPRGDDGPVMRVRDEHTILMPDWRGNNRLDALRGSFARGATLPATVIVIEIAEVYIQCAKALLRSGLWGRDDRDSVPTTGQILAEMTDGENGGAAYDADYERNAQPRMW